MNLELFTSLGFVRSNVAQNQDIFGFKLVFWVLLFKNMLVNKVKLTIIAKKIIKIPIVLDFFLRLLGILSFFILFNFHPF